MCRINLGKSVIVLIDFVTGIEIALFKWNVSRHSDKYISGKYLFEI